VRYNIFNELRKLIMATSRIEVYKTVDKRIILDLNQEEAEYLSQLTENYLMQDLSQEEEWEHTEHRSAIWCELNNCLRAK